MWAKSKAEIRAGASKRFEEERKVIKWADQMCPMQLQPLNNTEMYKGLLHGVNLTIWLLESWLFQVQPEFLDWIKFQLCNKPATLLTSCWGKMSHFEFSTVNNSVVKDKTTSWRPEARNAKKKKMNKQTGENMQSGKHSSDIPAALCYKTCNGSGTSSPIVSKWACFPRQRGSLHFYLHRKHICGADVAAEDAGDEDVYDHIFMTKTHNFGVGV